MCIAICGFLESPGGTPDDRAILLFCETPGLACLILPVTLSLGLLTAGRVARNGAIVRARRIGIQSHIFFEESMPNESVSDLDCHALCGPGLSSGPRCWLLPLGRTRTPLSLLFLHCITAIVVRLILNPRIPG